MSAAVPLRSDFTASDLRQISRSCKDAKQVRRLLALAAIYDGLSRSRAAEVGGMTRQTLRDWVHRFNAEGLEGLINHKACGFKPKLSQKQKQVLYDIVKEGADLDRDGVVRYRLVDLVSIVETKFGVRYGISAMWYILHSLTFSHVSGRPFHPKSDKEKQAAFRQDFPPNRTAKNQPSS